MLSVELSETKSLHYIDEATVAKNIEERGFQNDKATQNLERSDLTVHVYEGGFKVWECTEDLCKYIYQNYKSLEGKQVLELGCGAGLPAILTADLGAKIVYLQDFNEIVLKCFSSDNITVNNLSNLNFRLVSGSWEELINNIEPNSFDLILTSETIYNEQDYASLHDVISKALKTTGECLLAAKFFYFGVGGSIPSFVEFVNSKRQLQVEEVTSINTGVPRKIMRLQKLSIWVISL